MCSASAFTSFGSQPVQSTKVYYIIFPRKSIKIKSGSKEETATSATAVLKTGRGKLFAFRDSTRTGHEIKLSGKAVSARNQSSVSNVISTIPIARTYNHPIQKKSPQCWRTNLKNVMLFLAWDACSPLLCTVFFIVQSFFMRRIWFCVWIIMRHLYPVKFCICSEGRCTHLRIGLWGM